MKMAENVTVISRSFDLRIRRTWHADLINSENGLITLVGRFDRDVKHPNLGLIRQDTVSYEYYWRGGWHNVFCFYEPDGDFRNYYCNITMPPVFAPNILDYVDLDIDVVVDSALKTAVLDEEEFLQNVERFSIPRWVSDNAWASLDRILAAVEKRQFPFMHHS
jgi:protein associated with RNAse G/E